MHGPLRGLRAWMNYPMIHDTLTAATRTIRTAKATTTGRPAHGGKAAPGSGPAARVDISDAARARAAKASDAARKPTAKSSDPRFKPILWSDKLWTRYPSGVSGSKSAAKPKRQAPPAVTRPRRATTARVNTPTVLKRKATGAESKDTQTVQAPTTKAGKKATVTQHLQGKKTSAEMKIGFKDTSRVAQKNVRFSKSAGRSRAVRVSA